MGVTGDICAKITELEHEQIDVLEQIADHLQPVADVAHADLTIYCQASDKNFLVVVAQAKPYTIHAANERMWLGQTVAAVEEPLVLKTLQKGDNIMGVREMDVGTEPLEQETFPVMDRRGQVIAAVSMERNRIQYRQDRSEVLSETVKRFIHTLTHEKIYREISFLPITARDGIVIVDERGVIIFANAVASSIYKLLGVGRLLGHKVTDRHVNDRFVVKAFGKKEYLEQEFVYGDYILFKRAIPLLSYGRPERIILIVSDVTEVRKKEKELLIKQAVIQEIHHRVKNNLQTIASLLRLQARRSGSPLVKDALNESINRILSTAVVHEFLSQQDSESINIREVTKNILDLVIQNMLEPGFNIQTVLNGKDVILPSERAVSVALIINELVSNSVEHGFKGRQEGSITVDILEREQDYYIEVRDDGVGLPADFQLGATRSLGLQIVQKLVQDDLGGDFTMTSNFGTVAAISMPKAQKGGA
ncbi:MAG TPA: histidine kinase [Firmicutes bacterium]|nr:histidine kinase [Bacillota bacterium]